LAVSPADERIRRSGMESRLRNVEKRLRMLFAAQTEVPPPEPAEPPAAAGSPAAPKKPVYPTLADYVRESFAPTYTRRRAGGRWNWCPFWYEHDEAVSRLQSLWKSWEALHAGEDTSLGDWYRDHLDHQLPILLGPDGPFRDCVDRHWDTEDSDLLQCEIPPADNQVWQTA